ncbi:mismatched base pair and cruciform dna recognition [Trichoderma arundinaceum]|uniref:Mismatched base pair and cruciform dna recognition n=1 Tax=Trichoderma arundinaceum TaxID=490622 RepID=A0A395NNS1_TRIAR|nr:mismatched base pair and cruciform dna recognition [Trichoderma arundinaceum]
MSDNSNNKPSTLSSYVESATGAVQNALGNLTGNTGDKAKGEVRKENAEAEYDASQATAKLPGGTISSTGAFAKDDPRRTEGSWDQTVGAAKETLGGLVGNESLKSAGRQQNLEGQQQEAKGQLHDYGHGIGDRVQGTVGGAVSGLTGDREGQAHYESLHDKGKTQQRGAEHDIQKQGEANY